MLLKPKEFLWYSWQSAWHSMHVWNCMFLTCFFGELLSHGQSKGLIRLTLPSSFTTFCFTDQFVLCLLISSWILSLPVFTQVFVVQSKDHMQYRQWLANGESHISKSTVKVKSNHICNTQKENSSGNRCSLSLQNQNTGTFWSISDEEVGPQR